MCIEHAFITHRLSVLLFRPFCRASRTTGYRCCATSIVKPALLLVVPSTATLVFYVTPCFSPSNLLKHSTPLSTNPLFYKQHAQPLFKQSKQDHGPVAHRAPHRAPRIERPLCSYEARTCSAATQWVVCPTYLLYNPNVPFIYNLG